MKAFTPCKGKTACRDDGENCLVCGRGLEEIEETRRLIDALAELAIAHEYENLGEFTTYVVGKVEKKVRYRRGREGK
jgi:hypothetical protein